jgi:hypothetical protein
VLLGKRRSVFNAVRPLRREPIARSGRWGRAIR